MGSSIDDFLKKENIFAEAKSQAIKDVAAWRLATAMKRKLRRAEGGLPKQPPSLR